MTEAGRGAEKPPTHTSTTAPANRPGCHLWWAFLVRFLPLGAAVLAGAFALYANKLADHENQWRMRQQAAVGLEAAVFEATLRDYVPDAALLAGNLQLRRGAANDGPAARVAAGERLLSVARARQVYDQVRLLGPDGTELARVERGGDGAFALLPEDRLQFKGDRSYFTRAAQSPPGTVCVSALDLNQEHGRVQVPFRPTLRLSAPLAEPRRAESGAGSGVVVLNLDAGRFLRRLDEVAARRGLEIYLLNPEGYMLTGPDKGACWGFMFPDGRGRTFEARFPEVWVAMVAGGPGQVRTGDGLFTWNPVTAAASEDAMRWGAPRVVPTESWMLVSRLAPAALVPPWREEFLLAIVVLQLMAAGCCLAWAVAATRRSRAERGLVEERGLLRAVVGASRDAVVLVDDGGRVLLWNRAAEEMFGFTEAEMLGQRIHERLAPPEHRDKARQGLEGFAITGRGTLVGPSNLELEAVRRDGTRLPVELALAPLRLGGRWHAVGSLRDIAERKRVEARVAASEQRFRDVSEAISEFIWEVDGAGRYTFLTEDVAGVLGYASAELLGRTMFELMPGDEAAMLSSWFAGLARDGQRFSKLEHPCLTKAGETVWLSVSGVPVRGASGELLGYRGAAMDITDRKRSEQALMEREETIRAMSEASHDAIVMVDSAGRVSFWNRAAERIFGYSAQEAAGQEVHDLMANEPDRSQGQAGLRQFARTGTGSVVGNVREMTARRKDGSTFPVELSVAAFRVGEQWHAVATLRDITRRKQWQQRLEELATTDELTGLHNRRSFLDLARRELERSRRYGRPLSMLMLDVDHFKNVNDTWGHDAGDEVLRHLAKTCQGELREVDVLGRIGGEEFAVLLPETGCEAALGLAERLRRAVEVSRVAVAEAPGGELGVTISLGVACHPSAKDVSVEGLLKESDEAMYTAKRGGRNRVEVHPLAGIEAGGAGDADV